jgi:MerR family copper efflux transcriptional regulator
MILFRILHYQVENAIIYPLTNTSSGYRLSIPMSGQGLTITQAARSLGISTRTVRRFIKSGKIKAEMVLGPFGQEYRIPELPSELHKTAPMDNTSVQTPVQVMDIVRELQEKNLALAAQLGAATERIRNLESQVKLLKTAHQPWWKRLFVRQR